MGGSGRAFACSVGVSVGVVVAITVGVLVWILVTTDDDQFGHDMLKEFGLASNWTSINNGGFGSVPNKVMDKLTELRREVEKSPDIWFTESYKNLVDSVRDKLAKMVNASDTSELVLIENASTGINDVLRTFPYSVGDKILIFERAYQSVIQTLTYLNDIKQIEILRVPNFVYPLPSQQYVVDTVEAFVVQHLPIRLASISHIESRPSTVFPLHLLIPMLHNYNITVVIDGAHALGNIPIDLQALKPDYYFCNTHKWLFSPKGTGFLWVKPGMPRVVPTVISATWGNSDWTDDFVYTGTRDYTSFAAILEAISWRESIGGEQAIMDYNRNLAWTAGQYLAGLWNSTVSIPQDMASAMIDIKLVNNDQGAMYYTRTALINRYGEYPAFYPMDGTNWIRISAQIFLELSDFQVLGDRINQLYDEYYAQSNL
ncbi:PLP-dependent transferase [Pelomyxa schiedti]|nr:PLP-dependent transferase [Pelomyxa schiedti]